MGQVWRAFDTRRARYVALKLVPTHPDVPAEAQERMHREAQLVGGLSSAHVIPVHDFGWINGDAFLDMRLVPGGDLATLLHGHPRGLEPHRAARIVAQIADALDAAHLAGLVHCDVKPSNVLLDTTAAGDFCYLADFGVATLTALDPGAKSSAASVSSRPSARDLIFGTPSYMAPELFNTPGNTRGPSVASDVYALAVLLHELLTGRPPFPGEDLANLHQQHTHLPPPPVSGTNPALSALDPILDQALAKDPERRHSSAGALAAAIITALAAAQMPAHAAPLAAPDALALVPAHDALPAVELAPRSSSSTPRAESLESWPPYAPDDSLEAVFMPSLISAFAPGPASPELAPPAQHEHAPAMAA